MEAATRECASRLGTSGSEMRFGVHAAVSGRVSSRLAICIESQALATWLVQLRAGLLSWAACRDWPGGTAHVWIVGCSVFFERDRFNQIHGRISPPYLPSSPCLSVQRP